MPAPATVARFVLVASAVPFFGIGAAFLVAPHAMAAHVGLQASGATAAADLRAVYGGLQLACGGLLVYFAVDPDRHRVGLVVQLALYTSLAVARLVSYAVSGLPTGLGLLLHGGEVVGVAAGMVAYRHRP